MKRQKSQYFTTKEFVLSSVKPSSSFHLHILLVNLNWFVVLTYKNIIPGQTKRFAGFSHCIMLSSWQGRIVGTVDRTVD